jgi:transcription elongation GreA/GreB family factor
MRHARSVVVCGGGTSRYRRGTCGIGHQTGAGTCGFHLHTFTWESTTDPIVTGVERDDLLGLLASARRAPDRRGTLGVVSKQALRDELLAQLVAALDAARAAYAAAIEGATHPEARAENAKDTRGLEQSYIARGQAQRVAELEVAVAELTKLELRALQIVAIGAVIAVDEDGATRRYFLVPHGGGNVLAGDIQVITPASPRGRALLGKRVGEIAELAVAGKTRELEITGVT